MQPCPRLSFKVLCQLTLEMLKSEEFLRTAKKKCYRNAS